MDLKAMNPYILRNRQKLYWDAGVPRVWVKDPWKYLSFLIQIYVTCEGRFSLIFLYLIILLMHLKNKNH